MNEFLTYMKEQRTEKYSFKDQNHIELVHQCLKYIGDPNGDIRDHIIYPGLAHLLHDKHLTKEQLQSITQTLISEDYLLYDLQNEMEWSVLRRSFSLLQLAILVFVHNRDDIFNQTMALKVFDSFMTYIQQETIFIGYNEDVGWAHAIAHSADLMAQLVQMKELQPAHVEKIWDCIATLFAQGDYLFISDEDERMVNVLEQSWDKSLQTEEEVLKWVQKLFEEPLPQTFPEQYYKKQNILHLCRSLFFRLEEKIPSGTLYETLKKACKNRR